MSQFRVVFIVAAIICFALKALGVGSAKDGQGVKIDLFSAGFACLSASLLP